MTPSTYYQEQCRQGLITHDAQQLRAVALLDSIHQHLQAEYKQRRRKLALFRKPQAVQGLYLWGGVGIGKTYLMDCFYHCVPFTEKKRMHFHAFMRWIHQALKEKQGQKNPLAMIVQDLAKNTLLLCLDELLVADITDAMMLANLFRALIANGITLMVTSNVAPDDLYKNGLQRPLFLPAIALLKTHTHVMHLQHITDYRLQHLRDAGVFHAPHNKIAQQKMAALFSLLTQGEEITTSPVVICEREIVIKKRSHKTIWLDFESICHIPRSVHDYLEIARHYTTIFISGIPQIPAEARNTILLFIRLIDVLYDTRIRLICAADVAAEKIYAEGPLQFEFARTLSRLQEMQSEAYFSQGLSIEALAAVNEQ